MDALNVFIRAFAGICAGFVESETLKAVDRLLLMSDADFPNDRRSLFVCAECGDLGCGASWGERLNRRFHAAFFLAFF
jgi:hypothetical protein